MRRNFSITLLVAAFLLMPATVLAAPSWIPIVPCGSAGQSPCTPCSLFQAVKNASDFLFEGIVGPVAAFMFVFGGGMLLVGAGSTKLQAQGRSLLYNTALGVVVILLAWVGTNFLVKSLVTGSSTDSWYQFTCPKFLADISAASTTPPGIVPIQPLRTPIALPSTTPTPGGNLCPVANAVQCNRCPQYETYFQQYAKGPATAGFLEAIMYRESSCNIGASSPASRAAGAYGLMMLLPSTANANKGTCIKPDPVTGKYMNVNIDGAWLSNPVHAEESICIAANYINALVGECGPDAANLAAGYNGGGKGAPGAKLLACDLSKDCATMQSCSGVGPMRAWECPWADKEHTIPDPAFQETRNYAPVVAACSHFYPPSPYHP